MLACETRLAAVKAVLRSCTPRCIGCAERARVPDGALGHGARRRCATAAMRTAVLRLACVPLVPRVLSLWVDSLGLVELA